MLHTPETGKKEGKYGVEVSHIYEKCESSMDITKSSVY